VPHSCQFGLKLGDFESANFNLLLQGGCGVAHALGVFQGLGLIFIASMAAAAAGFGHTVALFAAFVSFFGYFPWIVRLGYVRRKANQIPMVLLILMVSPSQALPAIEGLISVVYFSAGIAKLAESGPRWANGETFQSHLIATYLLRDRKSALWLSRSRTACAVISTVVLVWELTFPVVLILPQYKWIWVVTGVLFHLSTVPARIHYWIYFGPLYFVFLAPWGADWLNRHPW